MLKLRNLTDRELKLEIAQTVYTLETGGTKRFPNAIGANFLKIYNRSVENLTAKEMSPDFREEPNEDYPLDMIELNECVITMREMIASVNKLIEDKNKPSLFKKICRLITRS